MSTAPEVPAAAEAASGPPGIARRFAAAVYEGILLFGVLMIAAYLYSTLTQMRHALQGTYGLTAFLALILGIYFGWFWSRSGQTVAMKAWHLRLVTLDGAAVSQPRALARFALCAAWFTLGLIAVHILGYQGSQLGLGLTAAIVVQYCVLVLPALFRSDKQFLHDVVCGTRLITWRPALPPRRKA